jgi:hypothetical protein
MGVMSEFPAAATVEVGDVGDVPWGVLSGFPAAATTEVGDVGDAPWGVLSGFPAAATTEVGDVDAAPPERRCRSWRFRSAHQMCYKPARVS